MDILLAAAIAGSMNGGALASPCTPYETFFRVMNEGGATLNQTIELPKFREIRRLVLMEYATVKYIYGATESCVYIYPMFLDAPPDFKGQVMILTQPPGASAPSL